MPRVDRTARAATAARSGQRRAIACGAAVLLGGLVYLNALHNPFVYDDYHIVVQNTSIQSLANVRAILLHDVSRPIINLSYAIDRAIWGTAPFGFHVTNILLHMLNVWLLFHLTWRLVEDRRPRTETPLAVSPEIVATATAVLFAVHPLMTEAVGYISGRSEVLCATFFLLALLCGRRWMRGDGAEWTAATIVLWGAALATKEIAAMFPFVLLCYDWFVLSGTSRRILTVHAPLVGFAVVAGVARLAVLALFEHPGQIMVHWSYLLIDLDVVRRYIWLLLNPSGQSIFHDVQLLRGVFDPRALVAVAVVGLMLTLAWRVRRLEGLVTFGMFWFLLLLVPSAVLILLDQGEPMTEHRVYLASCGVFLAAGAGIGWLVTWAHHAGAGLRWLTYVTLGLILVSFSGETVLRNAVWADPVNLWRESVELAPNHYRPRLLLGEALQDAGRREEAVEQFQTVLRMRPNEEVAYMKLGMCLAEMGRLDEAESTFRQLQQMNPRSPVASTGLGAVAMLSRQPDRARQYFLDTIEQSPRDVAARQSLAILDEMDPANPAEALRLCEEIQHIAPETPGTDDCIRRNRSRLGIGSTPR